MVMEENSIDTVDTNVADTSVDDVNTESSNDDTSDVQGQEPAETDVDTENGEQQDNQTKADNAAGKPKYNNLEAALKGYANLEKLYGEQSKELGQLRAQAADLQKKINEKALQEANSKGFTTVKDYQNSKEIAQAEADAYAQHINECEYPEEMINLLNEYRANPSAELRKTIESQFPIDTIKDVASNLTVFKGNLQAREQQAQMNQMESTARAYLEKVVGENSESFKNPAFAQLFGEAFRALGCDLDAPAFIQMLNNYKTSILKQHGIQEEFNKQANSATDEIEGLSNTGNYNGSQQVTGNLLKMNQRELNAALGKLV